MTSLNAFVTPDAIHLATDGQTYINDDPLSAEVQKVALLANLPAVIGIRGGWMMLPSIVATISKNITSFDGLLSACPDLVQAVCRRYWEVAENSGDRSPRRAQFIIAGWSAERDSLEAYTLGSEGIEAWHLIPIRGMSITPWDAEFAARLGKVFEEDLRDSPEAVALHVMETQRDHLFRHVDPTRPSTGGDLAAGKFCQLTTLTRAGISTQILKRWQ